jgi:hypothetical protein
LCAHHAHLKQLLDAQSPQGGPSAASRFLPTRPAAAAAAKRPTRPPTTADDLAVLQAASSLLQELASGKLAATIGAFCQRACGDASDRQGRAHARAAGATGEAGEAGEPPPPPWAPPPWQRWAHADPCRALAALARDADAHAALLGTERAATAELAQLAALGVHPTAELALLRRGALSAEQAEGFDDGRRKLALLRLRREAAELDAAAKPPRGPLGNTPTL